MASDEETETQQKTPETTSLATILVLLTEALGNINNVRITPANSENLKSGKTLLEKAKTIARKLLKEEESKTKQTWEQMSKNLDDIKNLLTKPTYAQATATEQQTKLPPRNSPTQGKTDTTNNKLKKQQRDKLTVTITAAAAPDTTKNRLKALHATEMIQQCQTAIANYFREGHTPKIHGVNKLTNDEYRLHCESTKDPQLLSNMNWDLAFEGVKTKTRKYGLVVHGVPKKDLDPTNEDDLIMRDELEQENNSRNLTVAEITLLRRSQKHRNKVAAHHSVLIFTHSAKEADECLQRGMIIKGRFYYPEKYTPELNITQCYKCYKFGHLAKHCKSKQKCGNCGNEDHETANCTKETKCLGCGQPHPAWHVECSKRDEEGARLQELKRTATDLYLP